jgi:ribonuclease HI
MAKNKSYAICKGRRPGIYDEWFGALGAEAQIKGFPGAVYKGFASRGEAEAWFNKMSAKTAGIHQRELFPQVEKTLTPAKSSRRSRPVTEGLAHHRKAGTAADVVIYTDGGCSRNPGPGGYGVVMLEGGGRRELSGGFARTTNNRMELTACIKGLEALERTSSVIVYSDSQYVVNGIEKGWARRWKQNDWMRTRDAIAENSDLWSRLLDLCDKHTVSFSWVRGHDGNPENEHCDALAVAQTQRADLPPDHGYGKKEKG